ncbi:hypothetical protein [Mycolicibacterium hippocampi]|uniref:Uncharacterized protein n=1 Tax=Mycolicibacterium hippocampi TaxID=659824 RepID=A0A7I9ZIX8_9MYCO|nr:hypothetical protein [Mycolicibacterium hippocampi]GFH00971.1 hypothetical protein MHIP_14540 [Mycolicibacterium hippocampi]
MTAGAHSPVLHTHWNAKRSEVTHKIGKAGTSAFLLFNNDELAELRGQIDAALGGNDVRSTT